MPYPFQLRPLYKSVLWGGRKLHGFLGRQLPTDGPVGESWEVADFDDAATGRSYSSVIDNGPLAGRTLREAIADQPEQILGPDRRPEPFPLLVKFIDARENLSVQVHPNEAACARLGPLVRPKTECWYIVHADEGASVYRGLRPGVSVADFGAAVRAGRAVAELLNREPVRPGEAYMVPAGTVHAIGAGVLLAEVQQASDTTYRLWDWDRLDPVTGRPRELHLERGLACVEPITPPPPMCFAAPSEQHRQTLVACHDFRLEELRVSPNGTLNGTLDSVGRAAQVWITLAGSGTLSCGAVSVSVGRGQVVLLPTGLREPRWHWQTQSADLRVLVASPTA